MLPHTYRHRDTHTHTHRDTHTETHNSDIPWSYAVILCSLELYAILARRFMVLPTPSPLTPPFSPFSTYSRKNIPPKQKLCFHFPLAFLCQPSFFLSFFLFWESCLWNSFYYAACPALPSYLSLSLSPLGPSVSVSFGSTVLIDNKKIIHFIQRCRRNAAMPSI